MLQVKKKKKRPKNIKGFNNVKKLCSFLESVYIWEAGLQLGSQV